MCIISLGPAESLVYCTVVMIDCVLPVCTVDIVVQYAMIRSLRLSRWRPPVRFAPLFSCGA